MYIVAHAVDLFYVDVFRLSATFIVLLILFIVLQILFFVLLILFIVYR